eukprot:scaffold21033_cov112-Isochrysis_galbana.AAC.3
MEQVPRKRVLVRRKVGGVRPLQLLDQKIPAPYREARHGVRRAMGRPPMRAPGLGCRADLLGAVYLDVRARGFMLVRTVGVR